VSSLVETEETHVDDTCLLLSRQRRRAYTRHDKGGVPDPSESEDKFDSAEVDPHDLTTTCKPEAPIQSLNQLLVVTDLVDARSA
jgi:hypothetical protein